MSTKGKIKAQILVMRTVIEREGSDHEEDCFYISVPVPDALDPELCKEMVELALKYVKQLMTQIQSGRVPN